MLACGVASRTAAAGVEDTVADLVDRFRDGDGSAFATLYRLHLPAVYAVVRSLVGSGDADDLVHDVFVRALERLATLQDPGRFRPWLLAIARNLATDTLRARGRVRLVDADRDGADGGHSTPLADLADGVPGPDEAAELAELSRLVRGAVAGLSSRDAAAVTLVTKLGFSVAEVAAVFGITPGATKVLLHRARRRLREALAFEVLVRFRDQACPVLRSLNGDDTVTAGRHVRNCDICLTAARTVL